jgi:hypothetical protein
VDPANDSTSQNVRGFPLALLWLSAAAAAGLSIYLLITVLPRFAMLDQASGVWTSMAIDMAHGLFYRPLFSPLGYGGTRYFPLHFVIHAGLIRLGVAPITSGLAIAIVCGVALIAGVYCLLRNLNVPFMLAAPAALLSMATESGQMGITQIRGDLLPAALTVWGLTLVVRKLRRGFNTDLWRVTDALRIETPVLSGVLFALAFAAKFTSIFGPIAAAVALWRARQRKAALGMVAITLIGMAAVGIALMHGSQGRFLSVFRACCLGDTDMSTFVSAPAMLVRLSLHTDPMSLTILLLAFAGLLTSEAAEIGDVTRPYLICTAVVSVVIFASPGVWVNHLIDLHVASIVFLTTRIARGALPRRFTTAALGCAGALCVMGAAQTLYHVDIIPERQNVNATLAALDARDAAEAKSIPSSNNPRLYEHPMMAVMAGQSPYMLDPYMFAVAKINRPQLDRDLTFKLQQHYFSAVVLLHDPAKPSNFDWYDIAYFGKGFSDALLAHYRLLPLPDGCYVVYVPRDDDGVATAAPANGPSNAKAQTGAPARSDSQAHIDGGYAE